MVLNLGTPEDIQDQPCPVLAGFDYQVHPAEVPKPSGSDTAAVVEHPYGSTNLSQEPRQPRQSRQPKEQKMTVPSSAQQHTDDTTSAVLWGHPTQHQRSHATST